jgi:hypothetical protein
MEYKSQSLQSNPSMRARLNPVLWRAATWHLIVTESGVECTPIANSSA